MRTFTVIILFALAITMIGCASPESIDACVSGSKPGFLVGLLHGFIAPASFVLSIFVDYVAMYDVNNAGWMYDLGFLLGIGGFSGGILKSRRKMKSYNRR